MPSLISLTATLSPSAEAARPSTSAVAPEDLPSLVRTGAVLPVDVRSRWQHRHGHIPGSQSIPAGLLLAGEWPDGDLLLIGVDSAQSQELIETMHDLGYNRQLRYLQGGYQAWIAATHRPIRSGDVWDLTRLSGQRLTAGPALGMVGLVGKWTFKRGRA